ITHIFFGSPAERVYIAELMYYLYNTNRPVTCVLGIAPKDVGNDKPDNRGICANCQYLVPHYSNLPKAKTWRRLYMLQAKLHDDQGHAVDAEQARKMVQYVDDAIGIMEIQMRTRQDGGYLPFTDTLPPA